MRADTLADASARRPYLRRGTPGRPHEPPVRRRPPGRRRHEGQPWTTYSPEGLTWATASLTLQRRKRIVMRTPSLVQMLLIVRGGAFAAPASRVGAPNKRVAPSRLQRKRDLGKHAAADGARRATTPSRDCSAVGDRALRPAPGPAAAGSTPRRPRLGGSALRALGGRQPQADDAREPSPPPTGDRPGPPYSHRQRGRAGAPGPPTGHRPSQRGHDPAPCRRPGLGDQHPSLLGDLLGAGSRRIGPTHPHPSATPPCCRLPLPPG